MKKLNDAQIKALKHLANNPATLMLETCSNTFRGVTFWEELSPATINTFHSLKRRGLAEIQNENFWYISDEGKRILEKFNQSIS